MALQHPSRPLKEAKIEARLIGTEDPNEWEFPPKPKRMRWMTYERWEARFDGAEATLEAQICKLAARVLGWV